MLFVAKSLERIGDHATNIFEHVIYAVHGENLRHTAPFSP
jgi:phosphate transport system protein